MTAAPFSPPSDPVAPDGADRPSPWTRRALWANLVAQIGIIVTGGAVRLTGSGLGCSTWPQCEPGEFTPQFHEAMSIHSLIEFGNRTLTGVLAVIALAVVLLVRREQWRPRWFQRLAWVPLVGVAVQGVVGGVTVLVKLHPAVVGVHMLISVGLVAVSAVLLATDRRTAPGADDGAFVPRARTLTLARLLLGAGAVLVILGIIVTGAGPHGGDDEYAYRYALDPVLAAKAHAWAAWVFVALLVTVLVLLLRERAPRPARRAWWVLLGVTLGQGLIGYVQYFTGLPELLVGAHMLGTGVLTASLAWAYASLRPVTTSRDALEGSVAARAVTPSPAGWRRPRAH